ncbi:MAG: putative membrane protein [Methanobacterium sp. Maddingley MBC34]|nr:MAG: putative membrane protein [Methanobacterium sp. Maddingley MBC34]
MAFEFITQPIFGVLDFVFMPMVNMFGPMIGVFIISTIVAFFITLANKLLVDQDRLQFLQKEMKGFQQETMAAQKSGDAKAMAEVQKKQAEFMDLQKEMMMNSFKPMIVTMIPILLIFWWMAAQPAISKLVVELPSFVFYVLLVPLFHMFYHQSPGVPYMAIEWLGWYILCSFAMSLIFRKLMGLKTGGM